MTHRVLCCALVLLALAGCGDDDSIETSEGAARADCPCRLATQIDNLAVCIAPSSAFGPAHVYSTSLRESDRRPVCEPFASPQPVPAAAWSKLRVSAPCVGEGQLCVTVRAGRLDATSADDCVLAQRCSSVAYASPNQVAEVAPLAGWLAESSACAVRYEQLGGYIELTLDSQSLGCGMGSGTQRVTRVAVCPPRCEREPQAAGCEVCGGPQAMVWF